MFSCFIFFVVNTWLPVITNALPKMRAPETSCALFFFQLIHVKLTFSSCGSLFGKSPRLTSAFFFSAASRIFTIIGRLPTSFFALPIGTYSGSHARKLPNNAKTIFCRISTHINSVAGAFGPIVKALDIIHGVGK